ncbi:MAG: putative metalloprotease CJM1_0395 family protein [Thermodesulfobacteriota bacterium]
MLGSTPYINPAMIGGAGTASGIGPDARIRPTAPGDADPNRNRDARPGQSSTGQPVFPADADRVELSPAARQLSEQNSNAATDAREQNPRTATGPAGNNPRAEQNPTENSVEDNVADSAGAAANSSDTQPTEADKGEEDAPEDASSGAPSGMRGEDIPPEEQQEVQELKQRDQVVRTHEAAHAAVGGQYAGAPTLEYETGPDGKRYAVSGEVNIDLSEVKGDPQETIDKMEQVQAAALAPAQPSAQDRRVASRASQIAAQARMDLRMEQSGATTAQTAAPSDSAAPAGGENENEQQPPRVSTPAVTIESLRWSGAVA